MRILAWRFGGGRRCWCGCRRCLRRLGPNCNDGWKCVVIVLRKPLAPDFRAVYKDRPINRDPPAGMPFIHYLALSERQIGILHRLLAGGPTAHAGPLDLYFAAWHFLTEYPHRNLAAA